MARFVCRMWMMRLGRRTRHPCFRSLVVGRASGVNCYRAGSKASKEHHTLIISPSVLLLSSLLSLSNVINFSYDIFQSMSPCSVFFCLCTVRSKHNIIDSHNFFLQSCTDNTQSIYTYFYSIATTKPKGLSNYITHYCRKENGIRFCTARTKNEILERSVHRERKKQELTSIGPGRQTGRPTPRSPPQSPWRHH